MYWHKRKDQIKARAAKQQKPAAAIPTKDLFKELLGYAGPFIIVGLATSLYQIVDMFTFERAMTDIGASESVWQTAYSAFNFYGHKLVVIPGTIATGLSLAMLPALTKSFTENNRKQVFQQINQSLQIIFVLVIPAAVGLTVLSDVAYGALYGMTNLDITGNILAWYAPVALFFSLFTVTASILQGINQQRFTVVSLGAGLLLKILFNVFLIHTFGAKGAVFGTAIAAITAVMLNLWRIKTAIGFPFKPLIKRAALVLIFSTVMTVVIFILKWLVGMFVDYEASRSGAVIMLVIGVAIGGGIYLWLGYASTLLERTLGNRIKVLDRIFKR
ncbi:lipid II flippase MurJ [Lentibacillus sp. JNUCC-1]|uniref:lipid II flippase MurJ n=1 Tax=Lentibacillus sp. JNUCC-1 TaxID=2654513 RepID=UPI002F91A6A7